MAMMMTGRVLLVCALCGSDFICSRNCRLCSSRKGNGHRGVAHTAHRRRSSMRLVFGLSDVLPGCGALRGWRTVARDLSPGRVAAAMLVACSQ
ncbi:hypothetical protein TcBrA4_0043400 [Trypanosoma cruzi]|nr:hypothetical protein TcBrA4_0043400 [Trypanosoma cruzi]